MGWVLNMRGVTVNNNDNITKEFFFSSFFETWPEVGPAVVCHLSFWLESYNVPFCYIYWKGKHNILYSWIGFDMKIATRRKNLLMLLMCLWVLLVEMVFSSVWWMPMTLCVIWRNDLFYSRFVIGLLFWILY